MTQRAVGLEISVAESLLRREFRDWRGWSDALAAGESNSGEDEERVLGTHRVVQS